MGVRMHPTFHGFRCASVPPKKNYWLPQGYKKLYYTLIRLRAVDFLRIGWLIKKNVIKKSLEESLDSCSVRPSLADLYNFIKSASRQQNSLLSTFFKTKLKIKSKIKKAESAANKG